jgi:N utilization substance protein B
VNRTPNAKTPKANVALSPEQALAQTLGQEASSNAPAQIAKKPPARSARTRAREFALQALYQLLIGKNDPSDIDLFTRDLVGFKKADSLHYDSLLHGCASQSEALDAQILPHLDRSLQEISPIERACMWMGVFEFTNCLDVPWRVVLNEYIELSKQFGGTDGHKYVNAVLNALAPKLRSVEVSQERAKK